MGQKIFNALLFDTRSIQRYIYSGNKLTTNIGASYIVDSVFQRVLIKVLTKKFPDVDFSAASESVWEIDGDNTVPWKDMKSCCVAYIGGGNALLLFDSDQEDKRTEIVSEFTRHLLVNYPGLRVGAAQGKLSMDEETGQLNQDDIDNLYTELKRVQNNVFPAVNVPYTGLTLSCEVNNETANYYGSINDFDDARFFSQEVAAKFKAAENANRSLKNRFNKIFAAKGSSENMDDYELPLDIDKLGQKDGEKYFAIVHVDGNNMGLKFRGCETLTDRRRLSREIRRKTEGAFADLLLKIIKAKTDGLFDDCLNLDSKDLPIRPLIIGGDDVTYVCPANMAIMFTKTLMELLNKKVTEKDSEHLTMPAAQEMDCCAGVAILPAFYPFFRGYTLAEQLCDSAKKAMRQCKDNNTSWLDFAILHGEQSPTLEQIRETEYRGARGDMHFAPYRVANSKSNRHNIENILSCTTQFCYGSMTRNKVKGLRFVLQRGEHETNMYLQQLNHLGQKLPVIPDWKEYIKEDLWSGGKERRTPYVDAIELMDFYLPEVSEKWQS